MIKLMIFKWGDYPGLCRWVQCNKRNREAGGQRKISVREKLEDATGFED